MKFSGKFKCEAGRTISRDARPLFYVNIVREPGNGGYALAPWQADSLARQISAALNTGALRIPDTLADM